MSCFYGHIIGKFYNVCFLPFQIFLHSVLFWCLAGSKFFHFAHMQILLTGNCSQSIPGLHNCDNTDWFYWWLLLYSILFYINVQSTIRSSSQVCVGSLHVYLKSKLLEKFMPRENWSKRRLFIWLHIVLYFTGQAIVRNLCCQSWSSCKGLKKQDLSIILTLRELDQDDPVGQGGAQEGGDKVRCHLKTFIGRIKIENTFYGCED